MNKNFKNYFILNMELLFGLLYFYKHLCFILHGDTCDKIMFSKYVFYQLSFTVKLCIVCGQNIMILAEQQSKLADVMNAIALEFMVL